MATQHSDLELNDDIGFQRREWQVQRAGWVVFMLIVALGLLGLFGSGPLSDAKAGDPDGPIAVDYRRFVRQDAAATLTFQIGPDQVTNGSVEFWLDSDCLHGVDIEKVSPEPSEVRLDNDRLTFTFPSGDLTSPVRVKFSLRPQEIGILPVDAGVIDGPELSFRQISYP